MILTVSRANLRYVDVPGKYLVLTKRKLLVSFMCLIEKKMSKDLEIMKEWIDHSRVHCF